jgi:hypothetical protein
MAGSTSSLTNIKDSLECTICKDIFYDPVSLRCGHTFCMKCIANIKTMYCPICYRTIGKTGCSKNIVIDKILGQIYPEREILKKNIESATKMCKSKKFSAYINAKSKEWMTIIKDNSSLFDITEVDIITRDLVLLKMYNLSPNKSKVRYFSSNQKTYLYYFTSFATRLKLIKDNANIFDSTEPILAITHESINLSRSSLDVILKKHLRDNPDATKALEEVYKTLPSKKKQLAEQKKSIKRQESESESTSSFSSE